ncbi:hypothetical protein CsSME_00021732 [Camellia sinensis var. sinensis]
MGKYRFMVSSPGALAEFRREYNIPDDVHPELAKKGDTPWGELDKCPFTVVSIMEGGLRFPVQSLICEFLRQTRLCPTQVSNNTYKIINGVAELNRLLGLNLGLAEIFHQYTLSKNKDGLCWYLKVRKGQAKLIEGNPDKETNDDDFLWVSGRYEDTEAPIPGWYIRKDFGIADYKLLAEDYSHANQEVIRVMLRHPAEERESPKLLGFEPTYHYIAPRKSRVTDFLRALSPEPDPNLPLIKLVPLTVEQEMAKIRAIKSMITGEASDSQPPEAAGETSSTPAAQGEGAVLALASEQAVGRSKKRLRKDKAEQHLTDEDSTEHASTDLGDQTEQPITGPSKRSSAPPVWLPELSYKGRAVCTTDSVYADKDYSLGFNMTKGLLLPVDMKKHDGLSDLKVLCSAVKSIVLAAQKNYLAHERMIAVQQSLRDAISDNKAKTAELTNLKAAQEAAEAERDTLIQKLARAEEDK